MEDKIADLYLQLQEVRSNVGWAKLHQIVSFE